MGEGVNLFPLDSSGSTIPPFQLHPVFRDSAKHVPPSGATSCLVGFEDKSRDSFKNSFQAQSIEFSFFVPKDVPNGFRKKISCPLEGPPFLHELGDVGMDDAVPLLNGIASRQQVLGVVISDLFEWAVFALLGRLVSHDGHCDLNVCVAHLWVSEDEVTFQLPNASDANLATLRASVAINDVLEDGPVVDAIVGVEGEVEAQVRQVVLLLTPQRFS